MIAIFFRAFGILYSYRELLFRTSLNELRQRYAGTILGVGWAFVYPLGLMLIYATLYVVIFRVRPPGMESETYTLFVLSGLIPLLMYSETSSNAAASVYSNRAVLLNTVFPVELIPVRACLASQIPYFIALCTLWVASSIFLEANIYLFPVFLVFWVLYLMFIIGIGWILSILTIFYRDISQGLGLFNMIVIILSPAAYTESMIPSTLKLIFYINPFSYFVQSFQSIYVFGVLPETFAIVTCVSLSLSAFFIGFFVFTRLKFECSED